MRRRVIGLVAAATLGAGAAFGIAACGGDDDKKAGTAAEPQPAPAAPTTEPTAPPTVPPQTITTQTQTTQTDSTETTGGTGY